MIIPISKTSIHNQNGQSTIEFLISIIYVIGLMFLFVKIALNVTNGYLVHYATFMASRAYLVLDNNANTPNGDDNQAGKKAEEVFKKFNIPSWIPGDSGKLIVNYPESGINPVYLGVYHEFQQKFGPTALMGGNILMDFTSESFLGREPTRATCVERICHAFQMVGGDCKTHSTFFDNGC